MTIKGNVSNWNTFLAEGVGIDESGHLVVQRVGENPEVIVAADVVHATIR